MSVNERLSKIEEHLSGQDKVLEKVAAVQDKILEKMDSHHVSIAEAHEGLRWIKIIGGSLISFLSAHAAWIHLGEKHGRP